MDSKPSFVDFGRIVMTERERSGVRGISQEHARWRLHIETASFASKPIDHVAPADIAAWLRDMQVKKAADRRGERELSRHTIHRCLSLVSAVFAEAGVQGRGYIETNPCLGIRVKARATAGATKDPWAWLTFDEQRAIESCEAIDEADRLAIMFAIGTGLRQGEQFNLHQDDLVVDGPWPHVHVRFGSRGKPPKSGKPRKVPLLPAAHRAAKRWLELLPAYAPTNPERLVFPHANGKARGVGKPLGSGWMEGGRYTDPFKVCLRSASVTRNVRWHDLRHTCASSLVQGMWGRRWSLEEVREMLGHSSITITQRYGHLGETALKTAARETQQPETLTLPRGDEPGVVRSFLRSLAKRLERIAS